EKLPGYMIPGVIVALDKIPLTASGKVDRAALPMPELKRDQQVTLPRTPEEKMLRSILQDLLRVEEISIHDSFFDLGGHSLLATQAITRLREAFKVELPLRVFFDKPTIAELAAFIGQELERGAVIQVATIRPIARLMHVSAHKSIYIQVTRQTTPTV